MDTSNKLFIKQFHNNFKHLANKKVAFYGVGQYTRILLEQEYDFQVVGLMDSKMTGQIVYGKKVLSDEEVIKKTEIIIIVANLSVAPQIYQRIKELAVNNGIEVYYLNGLKPQKYNSSISEDLYWNASIEELKNEISKHDIISFDIFDTLLVRKCVKPEIIFKILQLKYDLPKDFSDKRVLAEKVCYHELDRYFTLEQVYQVVQESYNGLELDCSTIMEKEIELEARLLERREEVIKILEYCYQIGKKIILVSDMYLPKAVVEKNLKSNNIFQYQRLFLSCEEKADKYWGSMWEVVKANYPNQNILHIGDHEIADKKTALEHGIKAYRIASQKELMEKSGLCNYFGEISDIGDYMLQGLFLHKTLDDPFALCKWNGKMYIDSMYDFGYLFLGPLILKYLLWLKEEIEKNKINTLLFVARDGYLLEKLFHKLVGSNSTKTIYYFSSRRAASIAALENNQDIWFVFDKMCNTSSVKYENILKNAFSIEIDSEDELYGKSICEIGKKKMYEHTCHKYGNCILEHAEKERENYLQYISKLSLGENLGFVNFVCRGVTQYWTEKILHRKMKGFYFAAENDIIDIYPEIENIHCLYPKFQSIHTSKYHLIAKCLYGETILTAPQGTVICFGEDGKPIFEKKCNAKFALISECHKGIENYVEDMLEILHNLLELPKVNFSLNLVDKMFGLFSQENIILSEEIKEMFEFEDLYGK